ncbi:MAG: fructose-1,6-bisphosphatase, partial [Lachnospiraceae bacterium]|nr:fructose-1,6-bisphosphatase [Lachnospiraceae bacterium]
AYYNEIIHTIIRIGIADDFIVALANLIQRLIIDHLHIIGDVFDRGPGPHIIMDTLCDYHSLDIEWGNHDVSWMGAAAGHRALIANVIRIASRYGNLDSLEEGYGINLIPLATFALETYTNHDCSLFAMKGGAVADSVSDLGDASLNRKMHKAIAIIQFKLEEQIIKKRPEFEMGDRDLLSRVNYEKGTILIDGQEYPLLDKDFPTIDPDDPTRLTPEEEQVMERLTNSFLHSEKLQKHVRFLFTKGSMYKVFNGNLLYHGCVPMDKTGKFQSMNIRGKDYAGKDLFDILEKWARLAYVGTGEDKEYGMDILWYLWTGPKSPVYGKAKMATFERYFVEDKKTHKEEKNAYYQLYNDPEIVGSILKEFGLTGDFCHIVNGHVPVEQKKGESPVKCGGKLLVIDGGFSKAYQKTTGIAGYTLVYNSHGMRLVAHEPFESMEAAIRNETDIFSDSVAVETAKHRINVSDTDAGAEIENTIKQLEELLKAYREGVLYERG